MKKVGIMTHHKFYNQGTMLQAYALQKKIELMGQHSEIINYTTTTFRNSKKDKIKKIIKNPKILIERLNLLIDKKKNAKEINKSIERFDYFYNNYMKLSKEKYISNDELKRNPPDYDIYMVGSDQTWNPYIKSNKETYLLDFVPNNKVKTSYAPSIGGKEIPEESKEVFKKNLETFYKISCREEKAKEILQEIVNKDINVVLDPTFLLTKEEWSNISVDYKEKPEKKYLLCYFLGRNSKNIKLAQKIAEEKELIPISIYNLDSGKNNIFETKFGIGPLEFIDLLKNADYICTDSFHGCVFSIIFNKQFMAFKKRKDKKGSDNNRLIDLLTKFELEERMYNDKKSITRKEINYEKVNKILAKEKSKSEKFLKECIGDINV